MTRQSMTAVEQDFHERMHAAQMYGLWELASQMTRHPEPKAVAHLWKSSLIEAMVRESGEVVPVGEERRALQLFTPVQSVPAIQEGSGRGQSPVAPYRGGAPAPMRRR